MEGFQNFGDCDFNTLVLGRRCSLVAFLGRGGASASEREATGAGGA